MHPTELLTGLLIAYLFPILLIVLGLFLSVVGLASRDERTERATKATRRTKSRSDQDDVGGRIEIGPLKIPSPFLPRRLRFALMIVGGLLVVIGLLQIGRDYAPASAVTAPSLISVRYVVDDFDPRMVDLRTVSTSGIPVSKGRALRLFDFWVMVPENAPGYQFRVEVYANDERIGCTRLKSMDAGVVVWDELEIESYKDGTCTDPEHWSVQSDWQALEIALAVYRGGERIASTGTLVRLDDSGTSWLFDPPNLSFASIVYAVNGDQPVVLDLRSVAQAGIDAGPGDELTILEIWYTSNASSERSVSVEAFLSSGEFDLATDRSTQRNTVQKGVNPVLDVEPLKWVIPDNRNILVLWLLRSGRGERAVIMDGLNLPIAASKAAGLVPHPGALVWPVECMKSLDFEEDADLANWTRDVGRSSGHAYTGSWSLQASRIVTEAYSTVRFTTWEQAFSADALVIHYYLPSVPKVDIDWMEFCILGRWDDCERLDETRDQWHTVIFDFYRWPEDAEPSWDGVELSGLAVLGRLASLDATEPVTYNIHVDAVQVFGSDNE